MADQTTPAAAPAAPAPAAEPAAKPTPSEAGRTLRELREQRRTAATSSASPSPPTPKPAGAPSSTTGAPAGAATAAGDGQPGGEPSTDDALKLVREQRAIAEERKRLDAEKAKLKELDPDLAMVRAVREARAKKDVLGIVKALGFSEQDLYEGDEALFWRLAELQKQTPAAQSGEAKPVDVAKLVEEKLKEHDDAEAKRDADAEEAARREAVQRLESFSANMNQAVGVELTAKLKDYPAIEQVGGIPDEHVSNPYYAGARQAAAIKADPNRYVAWWSARQPSPPTEAQVRAQLQRVTTPGFAEWFEEAHGRAPQPAEVLKHFEGAYRTELEKRAAALGLLPAARPAPGPNSSWRGDVGSPPPPAASETLDDIRARRRAALEQRAR